MASSSYGTVTIDLQKAFAEVIKKICIKMIEINAETNETSLEIFLACRIIPLNKKSCLRPIGIGKILRRIAGKVVM